MKQHRLRHTFVLFHFLAIIENSMMKVLES